MARFSQPSFLNGPPQPLILTLEGRRETPLELYVRTASPSQSSFLLESGKSLTGEAQYSFLGSSPVSITAHESTTVNGTAQDPFKPLRQVVADMRIDRTPELPPFFGGAVGYFSYDFVRRYETLPSNATNDLDIPDLQFCLFDLITAIDHRTNRVQIIFCPSMERFLGEARDKLYREGQDRLAECEARLRDGTVSEAAASPLESLSFTPNQTKEAYLNRVRRCQEYIAAGDIYQANLSHRFTVETPPWSRRGSDRLRYEQALYRQLRAVNPSPFSGLLHFDDVSLISCSPERLVRLQGRHVETRPIAGTRPRGCK